MHWGPPDITALVRLGATNFRAYSDFIAVLLLTALVQGCAAPLPPSVSAGPAVSDPSTPAPRVSYRSTIGPYNSARPVGPAPWQQQNRQVAPSSRSAE